MYDRAKYYDVIFKRDVSRETKFVRDVYAKFGGGAVDSVIDIACGPGYHARQFAREGAKAYGLDLRAEMLRFAEDEAKKEGTKVEWLEADMRTYQLPAPVDVAICAFDSLDCLTANDDLVKHFQAVAANLNPKGVYIVDLSHPKEVDFGDYKNFHYHGERDGMVVDINWALNQPPVRYDLATGVAKGVIVEMTIDDNGKKVTVRDQADERLLFPQELTLLAKLSGSLEAVAWHGDYDLAQPLDHSAKSRRLIGVFQKRK
jgi:SAM-dependent methyltransferase